MKIKSRILVVMFVVAGGLVTAAAAPVSSAVSSSSSALVSFDRASGRRVAEDTQERSVTAVVSRKIRLQRVLGTLDHVAEISLQMNPDYSRRLEPVVIDLAEQALALSGEETIARASTDSDLDRLEGTVQRLVDVLGRMVEPELSI